MSCVHNFDEPINRVNTDSFKWDYEGESGKYIPLGVADTDFKAPREVIDAVRERVDFGVFAYGYLPQRRFADAVCGWYRKRYKITLESEAVRHSQGLMTGALWMILNAYTRPGDKILLQPPVYNTFNVVIQGAGRFVETNDLILKDGRYEIDFEDFEAKVKDPRTKLFILCNPQNPTGRVFSREELIRLGELCLKYHVTVLSDEIHSDLVYSGHKHIPFASISKEFEQNTISFMNPSKTFNLPGFRTAAFIAANPVLKNAVHDMVVNNKAIGENICGTVAFCTAYEQCAYYADQMVAYLEENRNLVEETLKDVDGIDVIHAEGTYLLWLDCRKLNMSQEELDRFFVETVKLGLNSGKSFGPEGAGFLRMNIACPRSTVKEAMNRIVTAVKAL